MRHWKPYQSPQRKKGRGERKAKYKHGFFSAWHLPVNNYSKSNLSSTQNIFFNGHLSEIPKFSSTWSTELHQDSTIPQSLCSLCSQWLTGGEGWSLLVVHTYTTALLFVQISWSLASKLSYSEQIALFLYAVCRYTMAMLGSLHQHRKMQRAGYRICQRTRSES